MALETLLASQREAAGILGINYGEFAERQQPRIVMQGTVNLNGLEVPAFRAHSGGTGDDKAVGKGGIRMAAYPTLEAARGTVSELSVEMLAKLALRGVSAFTADGGIEGWKGAKGLIVVDANSIDSHTKDDGARQFENLMADAGLSGYDRDVPAGDVGTNGLADAYALERRRRNPEDPYWQASITGKSPKNGGLPFRTSATGWGGYVTQVAAMNLMGANRATTAIQGFGNVGAWHGHFATTNTDRIDLVALSDRDGTLHTSDPAGFHITLDMVKELGDNLDYRGPKMHALADMIAKNQPGLKFELSDDPNLVLYLPVDHFVPAAMGNVITKDNVGHLGARRAIIEDANGPTEPTAHRYATEHGIEVLPDIVTNGGGVDCSIKEHTANVDGLKPTTNTIQKELTHDGTTLVASVWRAAERMGTRDLRVAAAGVSMAQLLRNEQPELLASLIG